MMGKYVFVQEIVNTMADIFVSPFKAVTEITLEYILREGFSALIMYPIVIYVYCMLFRWITNLAKKEVAVLKALFRKSIRRTRKNGKKNSGENSSKIKQNHGTKRIQNLKNCIRSIVDRVSYFTERREVLFITELW